MRQVSAQRIDQLFDVPLIQSNVSVVQWSDWLGAFARRAADEVVFMDAGQVAHRAPVDAFFNGSAPDRVVRFLSRMHS